MPALAEPLEQSFGPSTPIAQGGNGGVTQPVTVRSLFASNRWQIIATYGLLNVENVLRLAQPFVLGWAIDDLLRGSWTGLLAFVVQHFGHLLISLSRQVYDTRTFTRLYSDVVSRMIVEQRSRNVALSCVAARSRLAHEYIDFLEQTVPTLMRASYSVAGSLIMLAFYDWVVVGICLALSVPAALLSRWFGVTCRRLSRGLHDQLEREVAVIDAGQGVEVRAHFNAVSDWKIRLSNAEALNFGSMEVFVLIALVLVLVRMCQLPGIDTGGIFAVFRYLMLLLVGLDQLPRLIQQVSRLRDVHERVSG